MRAHSKLYSAIQTSNLASLNAIHRLAASSCFVWNFREFSPMWHSLSGWAGTLLAQEREINDFPTLTQTHLKQQISGTEYMFTYHKTTNCGRQHKSIGPGVDLRKIGCKDVAHQMQYSRVHFLQLNFPSGNLDAGRLERYSELES